MKCPVCKDVTLLMSEKNGVEIDYCPECRGIWLDRGELDKIVERARTAEQSYREEHRHEARDDRRAYSGYDDRDSYDERRRDERRREERRYDDDRYYKDKKKKKQNPMSALSDIMEIFGGD